MPILEMDSDENADLPFRLLCRGAITIYPWMRDKVRDFLRRLHSVKIDLAFW